MSTVYRFAESETPHFITMTLVEWVDIFSRKEYKDVFIHSLVFCRQNKNLRIHAYVIMTNHVHLIVSSCKDSNLTETIRDLKRYTARQFYEIACSNIESRHWIKWIFESQGKKSSSNKNIKVWKHENHPVPLDTNVMFQQKLDYIHENPVKAGVCYQPEEYLCSSAGYYAGRESLIEIDPY